MRALSGYDILQVWEQGQRRHPIDRALTILAAACPEAKWEELVALSVGRRDQRLLKVRELTLGGRMRAYAECPQCREQLEFELDTSTMLAAGDGSPAEAEMQLEFDGYEVRHRLPNSMDLAAIADKDDAKAARDQLLSRCIIHARQDDRPVAVEELPAAVLDALDTGMEESDPLSDLQLNVECSNCAHKWPLTMDILSFFWAEISDRAKRFLADVHTLARAYGWSESDILAMSDTRRRYYLEMIG
jgi:hypothetical protein